MSHVTTLFILFLAAILEAGGDALVRAGLRAPALPLRLAFFGSGAIILFSYGCIVNTSTWDFGRLLGVYIVFFFIVAQAISWSVFSQPPGRAVLLGGAFVVVGGVIMSTWSN